MISGYDLKTLVEAIDKSDPSYDVAISVDGINAFSVSKVEISDKERLIILSAQAEEK